MMGYRSDGSYYASDEDDLKDAVQQLRSATERPLGKLTYQVADQRLFDQTLDRLFSLAGIDPLGA